MTTTFVTPLLTDADRRQLLCEFADLYAEEPKQHKRPVTKLLPALMPLLVAPNTSTVLAINTFARLATQRAILQSGDATGAEIDTACVLAGRLLDELVGAVAA